MHSLCLTDQLLSPQNPTRSMLLLSLFCGCYCSVTKSCLTLCNPMDCSTPGFPVLHHHPEFTQTIESVMPSNRLILCHPPLLPPSIFPSLGVFSNELALHTRWPQYWSFSFSIHPFNEYSGLISFRIDWFDLLTVQGTLKSLLQYHSAKESILWCLAFSGPTLTSIHDYWKNHSFDHTDLCRGWCLCVLICCLGLS